MIARCVLQAVEVRANLWVGPVRVADQLAAHDAAAVNDVGLGTAIGVVKLGGCLVGVADGGQGDVAHGDEALVVAFIFVDADGEDGQIGAVAMQLQQAGEFLNAWNALRPPEIEQNNLAAIVGQMNGGCAVGDCKVWSGFAGQTGMGSAIAGRHEGQRDEQRDD